MFVAFLSASFWRNFLEDEFDINHMSSGVRSAWNSNLLRLFTIEL